MLLKKYLMVFCFAAITPLSVVAGVCTLDTNIQCEFDELCTQLSAGTCNTSVVSDFDSDGIPDDQDNCPYVDNADQADTNLNGVGDACESAGGTGGGTGGGGGVGDTIPPEVVSITRTTPAVEKTNADTLVFTVTFSETVDAVDGTDFFTTGLTGLDITAFSTSVGSIGQGDIFEVTVSGGDLANFEGELKLAIDSYQEIFDLAGNKLTLTGIYGSYIVDNTPPALTNPTDVTSPTNGATPKYTFLTDENGTITMGGSCGTSSSKMITAAGDITITLTKTDDATPLDIGTYSDCTVQVTDEAGNASNVLLINTFDVTSPPVNNPPMIDPIADITVYSGQEVSIPFVANDDDGKENLAFTVEPTWLSINGDETAIVGTAPEATNEEIFTVTLTATDSRGETAFKTFKLTVKNNFHLHKNGVTILCPNAVVGESGVVNGKPYTKIEKKEDLNIYNGSIDAANACTSGITNMAKWFSDKISFNSDISHWDTSIVTNMYMTFQRAQTFNQDIGDWNTSNVINMGSMFMNAFKFNQDIGAWDTSNVTNMDSMFSTSSPLNQDLSSWCVQTITSVPRDFNGNFNDAFFYKYPEKQPKWGQPCGRITIEHINYVYASSGGILQDIEIQATASTNEIVSFTVTSSNEKAVKATVSGSTISLTKVGNGFGWIKMSAKTNSGLESNVSFFVVIKDTGISSLTFSKISATKTIGGGARIEVGTSVSGANAKQIGTASNSVTAVANQNTIITSEVPGTQVVVGESNATLVTPTFNKVTVRVNESGEGNVTSDTLSYSFPAGTTMDISSNKVITTIEGAGTTNLNFPELGAINESF